MQRKTVVREQLLQGFWLGSLRIDPPTGSVTGNGAPGHLPSRAMEVLLVLAHQPGELVSRTELLDAVWGEGGGSEEALSHAVSELRHGLGDDATSPVFVQTLPRRGYRLLVEPRTDADSAAEPAPLVDLPLWRELMHRGVVQAGAAHLVVGWLLIQVAGATFGDLGLPAWTTRFVTYVVVAGFPVVLVLAWFLEFAEGRMTVDRGNSRRGPRSGLERNYLAIVAAYGMSTIAVGGYHYAVGIPQPETQPVASDPQPLPDIEPNSVAVLRFHNIDDDPRGRIFSDGLAEDVLDRLARVPGLLVASRTDSWSLPEQAGSSDVRRRLRVANYLEGSVRVQDDRLQVTVQLIDSATGFHRFSRTFARDLQNFMQVQKEITDLAVANLRIALEADTLTWLAASYVETDIDAYVYYRMGREVFDFPLTVDSIDSAIAKFRESLALDPGYAAAHAGICTAFVERYQLTSDASDIGDAERACAKALISNPHLYMVYRALGDLYRYTNRLEQAELAYLSALDRNPKDVDAMSGLAFVYESQHRIDAAESQLQRAIHTQPGNWRTLNAIGSLYFLTGRFPEAAAAFRSVVVLDPGNWQVLGNLGSALIMSGQFDVAADALEKALQIKPDRGSYSNLGIVYYYLGDFAAAVDMYQLALSLDSNSNVAWMNLADALHFAGDDDGAREAYRRAAELSAARLEVNAGESESLETLAWASAMLGDHKDARELMDRALAAAPNDPYAYYYDALIRHRAGDAAGALDAIETAIARGYSTVMLQADPYLEALHGTQRFTAMVARVDE